MSADIWLDPEPSGCTECFSPAGIPLRKPFEVDGHSINLTYNLSPMLEAAGFPGWKMLKDAPCSEVGGILYKVAETLAADRDKFEAMNPENGWGEYDQAVAAMYALAIICKNHPTSYLRAWL